MKLFYCELTWYDSYADIEQKDKVFVFAHTYEEACRQVNVHFNEIVKINLEVVNDDTSNTSVLFIEGNDEDVVQSIKNSNTY